MAVTVGRAGRRVRRRVLFPVLWAVWCPSAAFAQDLDLVGRTVLAVRAEQEGRPVADRVILGLLETEVGEPLSMRDVRQTIDHLIGLGRFDDIQVSATPSGDGVMVRYVLVPRHAVQALEFEGSLRLPANDLRQALSERFGALPPAAARLNDVARELLTLYRDRGYIRARIAPRVEEFHNPDRSVMVVEIDAGTRARIGRSEVEGLEAADRLGLLSEAELRTGAEYDSAAIQRRLARYENDLRSRGFYEARASHSATFTDSGEAAVAIVVDRGPRVSIAFAGDPLPANVRDELVPVRREGSADEDLLEDASRAIEEYLQARGYRDADAPYTRDERGSDLVITFTVSRGPRHVLDEVVVKGNSAVPATDVLGLLGVKTGEPFVQSALDAGIAAIEQHYRTRGFTRASVEAEVAALPGPGSARAADRQVQVTVAIEEGPRTVVSAIFIEGNTVLGEGQIRSVVAAGPGQPFSGVQVAQDRDRIQLEYLNRGYESVLVEPHVTLLDGDTRAEIRFAISEGPQVLVDHVIIVGNERTSTETIERELLLKPGEPLGYAARLESQQRLSALGLFRVVRITELRHGSEPRRDVLVEVEEAPPTTIGYGGGVEVDSRLRPTGAGGTAEERIEAAPRGFFEIGRRNLWGKNRSVNLFTRVSLRSRFRSDEAVPPEEVTGELGFNEYRVVGTFREPRIFNTRADLLVTGVLDQAVRSSFNFRRRQIRAEAGMRVSQQYGVAGRYSFERTELFDERFTDPDEPLLIDRLFPQVRLSKLSVSVFRDTRDDVLDPGRGMFLSADNDFAARSLGSEVGFAKTFLGALSFHRLPGPRRTVLALAGRVGLAEGFERTVNGVAVEDLPASERFFAGGDTTVRGFSLDRLGTAETITESGFPRGGNGVVVLNAELRVNVWRSLGMVGFLDAGNVFPRAADVDVTDLRSAAGFGLRYRSPVGPLRIDLGFNLDPREFVPGRLERRTVLHVSLGQAF
jgi:outer membrane protein assembly complex protein YaeT